MISAPPLWWWGTLGNDDDDDWWPCRGQGGWWGLATSPAPRWQVGLAPLTSPRLRLRSSDCNGVTTAVSSQPPARQHHTVKTSYQASHTNHRLSSIQWTWEKCVVKRDFVRCDRRDVLFLFSSTVFVKWTGINTIRLIEIGSGMFKMFVVQLREASTERLKYDF